MNLKKILSICAIMAVALIGCNKDPETGTGTGEEPGNEDPKDHFNPNIKYGSMTDPRDGKTYKTTVIDGVTWMAENLNYDMDMSATGNMPLYNGCYDYSPQNCEKYGRLYREAQRVDACPAGWRLPDTTDVKKLLSFVDSVYMENFMGTGKSFHDYLRAQRGWRAYENGTDDFGFSALPGGDYDENRDPRFEWLLYAANFWTSNDGYMFGTSDRMGQYLGYENAAISIRCIKNN